MRFEFDKLAIGDVMVTRNNYPGSWFVRMGQRILGKSPLVDHVIIIHHIDAAGVLWGIQGQPGGVGWVEIEKFRSDPFANANVEQPKNTYQRTRIVELSEGMLGTEYDWVGIVLDGMHAIGASILWRARDWKTGLVPAHVVCSSFADYIYEVVQLPNPGRDENTRGTMPGDWDDFIVKKGWDD